MSASLTIFYEIAWTKEISIKQKTAKMPHYLIDTFSFNRWANDLTLRAIEVFTDDKDLIGLFRDWITAQNKWMERVEGNSSKSDAKFFAVPFEFEKLVSRWSEGLSQWFEFWAGLKKPALQDVFQQTKMADKTFDSDEWRDLVRQLKNYLTLPHTQNILLNKPRKFKSGQLENIYQATKNQSKNLNKKITGVKIINDH